MSFISFFLSLADTVAGIIVASRPAPRQVPRAPRRKRARRDTNLAKGQTVPTRTVLPPPTRTAAFSVLCPDILLEVFSWASPKDLQAIRLVCKTFSRLLNANQYVWRLARANLDMGFALPAATATTEPSLASYIFDPAPCMVCGVLTSALLPFSFSLQIRFCSSACAAYLVRVGPESIDQNKALLTTAPSLLYRAPDVSTLNPDMAAMFSALPYLEWSPQKRWLRPSDIHKASDRYTDPRVDQKALVETWRRKALAMPASMELSEILLAAAIRYRRRKHEVDQTNRIFLRAVAKTHTLTFTQLVCSPTLARQVNAFTRDGAVITQSAWLTIRDVALAEVRARTVSLNGRVIGCPHCGNRIRINSLMEHIVKGHPAELVRLDLSEKISIRRCSLCPGSRREFTLKGLKMHVESAHLNTKRIWRAGGLAGRKSGLSQIREMVAQELSFIEPRAAIDFRHVGIITVKTAALDCAAIDICHVNIIPHTGEIVVVVIAAVVVTASEALQSILVRGGENSLEVECHELWVH
ncbi:hypothetical protein B0H13DRAFT_2303271 [Mycena leptocephala]|nr:hypothetical protein B0H13DRAFT_2303271 [Mycena leptocephala]